VLLDEVPGRSWKAPENFLKVLVYFGVYPNALETVMFYLCPEKQEI
jgi:hypothetical protein